MNLSFIKTKAAILAILSASLISQSCGTEEDLMVSVDWATQSHKGPSYPIESLDAGTYFFNIFLDFMLDYISIFGDDANSMDIKTDQRHFKFSIGPEFIGKGFANKSVGGKNKANLNYLEIPLAAVYQHYLSSGGKLFAGGGPYLSYGLFGKIKNGTTSAKAFDDNTYKRFDAGLGLTGGFKASRGLVLRISYDYGLANIAQMPNGDKTKNRSFSLNVGYDLDKLLQMKKKK